MGIPVAPHSPQHLLLSVEERKHSVILWLGLSLLVSLYTPGPWTWPVLLSPPRLFPLGGTGGWEGARVRHIPSRDRLGCGKTTFFWEQALLREAECPGVFQNSPFYSPPSGSIRRLFSNIQLWGPGWAPGGKVHKTIGTLLQLSSLGVLNSQGCPPWASRYSSVTVQVFLVLPGCHGGFCSWVSALVSCDSLRLCVSPIWEWWFALWPHFSDGPKKNC